jgi:3'-phosphoadenosine 5'-phosphosulfate sulfotransferase (PAPS reductase)/FAD synthetase
VDVDPGNLKITRKPLSEMRLAEYNPRTITDEAFAGLKESLRRYGWKAPIVWNRRTGNIVWGHQRYRAAQELGWTHAPVHEVDLSDEEEIRLNIVGNSQELSGAFDGKEQDLLKRLREWDPEGHDSLRLGDLEIEVGAAFPAQRVDIWATADTLWFATPEQQGHIGDASTLVVQYSGGMDSTAALYWATRNYPDRKIYGVYTDPGVELPGVSAHTYRVCELLGADFAVVKPLADWWIWLEETQEWPSIIWRPCIPKMIHEPFVRWMATAPTDSVIITGGRAEESVRGSAKTATSPHLSFPDRKTLAPMFAAKKDVVRAALDTTGIPQWDGYAKGFVRTACWCCPGMCGRQAYALQEHYPGLAQTIRDWESRLGRPIRRGGQDIAYDELVERGRRQCLRK